MTLEPRSLPVETVDCLVPPLAGFPYFAHAEEIKFDPAATGDHPGNASWLADASFLVYGDRRVHSAMSSRHRLCPPRASAWTGWDCRRQPGDGPPSDTAIVFVFRGTRLQTHTLLDAAEVVTLNQDDLWTDSQFFRPSSGRRKGALGVS